MAALGPVFLDTSTLLGGLIEMGPASEPSQTLMAAIAAGRLKRPATAWHCCLELYAVGTRLPAELRLTPDMALRLIEEEVLARFDVRDLPEKSRRTFLQLSAADLVAGGRIYDAHIAEVARASRARCVVTENRRHFVGLLRHDVKVLTAREFVEDELPATRRR